MPANFNFITAIRAVFDTVLPPRCGGSGKIVDKDGALDPSFWDKIEFIEKPFCDCCGIPFNIPMEDGTLCASCLELEPDFDRSRSAVVYNDASSKLVLNFKSNDKTFLSKTFVPWMLRAGKDVLFEADYIIPVPLHNKKLRERMFNQSALLAKEIARQTGIAYLPDGMLRVKDTTPQKGLNRKDRMKNVMGAFGVNPKHTAKLKGKKILLIDDVFTTGATLNECAKALKRHGVAVVNILTIARVKAGD